MGPTTKSGPPAYRFEFHDGQLCAVDDFGEPLMKIPPEDVESLVEILLADGLSLSGLEDALAEGLNLGIDVTEWHMPR
jgi:hypothetical protein